MHTVPPSEVRKDAGAPSAGAGERLVSDALEWGPKAAFQVLTPLVGEGVLLANV